MSDLKPCPFCGGKAVYDTDGKTRWVICIGCGAKSAVTFFDGNKGKEVLTGIWNRRTEPETAQWKIHIGNDHQMLECSGCGNRVIRKWYDLAVGDDGFNHCPYCGRVMTNAQDMVVPWPGYKEEGGGA